MQTGGTLFSVLPSTTSVTTFLVTIKSLSVDWLTVECWFPSFALLDYRVTNQIYIFVTRKSSSANSEIKQCLMRHYDLPEIKQCLMRHSDWLRLALLHFWVIYKFDWSLCNQAVQNSEINILPRVSPLTVKIGKITLLQLLMIFWNSKQKDFFISDKNTRGYQRGHSSPQRWNMVINYRPNHNNCNTLLESMRLKLTIKTLIDNNKAI